MIYILFIWRNTDVKCVLFVVLCMPADGNFVVGLKVLVGVGVEVVMVLPSESHWASKMASLESSPHASNHVSSHMIGAEECLGNSCISVDLTKDAQVLEDITLVPDDLALEGVKAAAQHACPSCFPDSDTFQAIMTEISFLQVTSICHIPKRFRPLLSEILALEFQQSVNSDLWGFVCFSFFLLKQF